MRAYDLPPEALVPPVGYLLPLVEVVVGLLLLAGLLTRGASVISSLLQVAFITLAGLATNLPLVS